MNELVYDFPHKEVSREEGVIRLPADLLFGQDEGKLYPAAVPLLRRLALRMADRLPCFGLNGRTCRDAAPILEAVYIEGHSDPFQPKRWPSNWELSSARAIATYQTMTDAAPGLANVRNAGGGARLVGVSAYAATRPTRLPPAGDFRSTQYTRWRAENRRIEFRFLLAPPRD